MDGRRGSIYYCDTTGNDFLGAIVHPFNGAFVSEENANFLAVFQEKDVRNRQWERSILAISWGLAKEGFGIE